MKLSIPKTFFGEFKTNHTKFFELIEGIPDTAECSWYASVMLNRLMFLYFLQSKGFLENGKLDYLQQKLTETQVCYGSDQYYEKFLKPLFFEAAAKPTSLLASKVNQQPAKISYLHNGLFLPHEIEQRYPAIWIPDQAFKNILQFFEAYSWKFDDIADSAPNEITPDVLGYVFEKYINQKDFGAYYTPPEITAYLCRQTIHTLILQKVNALAPDKAGHNFDSLENLLLNLDAALCREMLFEILPNLTILDPACGSGAFLVAALKTLTEIYTRLISWLAGNLDQNNDLTIWYQQTKNIYPNYPNLSYFIRKRIISDNLFGVDMMEEAIEIARLRLFMALLATVNHAEDLEPLASINFNLLPGNSLVGLLDASEASGASDIVQQRYAARVAERISKIEEYRKASTSNALLQTELQAQRERAFPVLNEILLNAFSKLGIQYEQASWDAVANKKGLPVKRALTVQDIAELQPFHWGYEFAQVMQRGFDVIITNPPWDIFKPQAKEFFQAYSALVTKKKMNIQEFEAAQDNLLKDPEICTAWLHYQSKFAHLSQFYRSANQYANQTSVVNGKKVSADINLYKLFTEQCYNLLRSGGQCGLVVPSGIYTDLGTKQLRELLFTKTRISSLFCFENRRLIFEGVHRSFKFVALTFEKGAITNQFPAAFMRLTVAELEKFPARGALPMSVELIRKLAPASLSIMEFKSELDASIAQKMLRFPLLGEKLADKWNFLLKAEFHMTNASHLFKTSPARGRLPLYEGKLIHQFNHRWENSSPRYWLDEKEARKVILGRSGNDTGQLLDYQGYRFGLRTIARNTDSRTLIAGPLPPNVFSGNSILALAKSSTAGFRITDATVLFLQALLNSFVLDYYIRQMVSANVNKFYIYQLPVPRLTEANSYFWPIVERAARLVCITPEFRELWQLVKPGVPWALGTPHGPTTDIAKRAQLRAELDGFVAYLYGLSEAEFSHILSTFPLVALSVREAALQAFRSAISHLIND